MQFEQKSHQRSIFHFQRKTLRFSLRSELNHFEIVLIDKFNEGDPPPGNKKPFRIEFRRNGSFFSAISLCTASPMDPPSTSPFRQDFLRFWPTGDGSFFVDL